MLITFKSAASGDVMMFEESGKTFLSLLGKDPEAERGIVTVEQLPGAIAAVLAAIHADKSMLRKPPDADEEADRDADRDVQLAQRAPPLLELLERSLQDKVPVTWGV